MWIEELSIQAKEHRIAAEAELALAIVDAKRAHRFQTIVLCLGLVFAAISVVATGVRAYYYAHPQPVEQTAR